VEEVTRARKAGSQQEASRSRGVMSVGRSG
jgi:hypothetical protein